MLLGHHKGSRPSPRRGRGTFADACTDFPIPYGRGTLILKPSMSKISPRSSPGSSRSTVAKVATMLLLNVLRGIATTRVAIRVYLHHSTAQPLRQLSRRCTHELGIRWAKLLWSARRFFTTSTANSLQCRQCPSSPGEPLSRRRSTSLTTPRTPMHRQSQKVGRTVQVVSRGHKRGSESAHSRSASGNGGRSLLRRRGRLRFLPLPLVPDPG